MRCADLAELISAYADDQTRPAQTEFLEAHLAVCLRCRATLQRYRQTARLLRLADPADEWRVPDLRLRLAHATTQPAARRPVRGVRRLAGGVVAAAAVCWAIAETSGASQTLQVAQGTPSGLRASGATLCSTCTPPFGPGPHVAYQPLQAIATQVPAQRDDAPPIPHPSGRGNARMYLRAIPL
jgi:anti-sigma factor RsiW